ncbi:MAG: flagellar biosynthetic protein FliR [Pseudomonadota bacterium]
MLIFCRVSGCILMMPAIGERYVPVRIRLIAALTITLATYPVIIDFLPSNYDITPLALAVLIFKETVIGLFFGLIARLFISASHIAGMVIAYQSGLASAIMFDPATGSQGSSIGAFLTLTSSVLFFVGDLHHLLLMGLIDSYSLVIFDDYLIIEDMTDYIINIISEIFVIGIQISAPYIVVGTLVYIGAGISSRLMPNMQIFFVLMPAQILLGFFILAATFSIVMLWYINHIADKLEDFVIFH